MNNIKLPAPTEHQIQLDIMNYLRLRGYYVMRLNSGRMSYEYKGRKGFMMLADKGTPDLMAFKQCPRNFPQEDAHIVFVEVKRPGNKPTVLQVNKMKELEEYGARCIVATSIEDLQKSGI